METSTSPLLSIKSYRPSPRISPRPSPRPSPRHTPKSTPRLRSPVIRIRSPPLYDPNTGQSYVISPKIDSAVVSIAESTVLDDVVDIIKAEERRRWLKGLIYLLILVITWVIAVQLANDLMKNTDYDHPLFVAALDGVFFCLFGLSGIIRTIAKSLSTHKRKDPLPSNASIIDTPSFHLSYRAILIIGMQAAVIYFISGACATSALRYTSSSNQTILSTTSSLFTLLLGVLTRVERFSYSKLAAIVVSISGICLITWSDSKFSALQLSYSLIGDMMAVLGAFAYSGYLIILRMKLGEQTDPNRDKLVYGCLGLSTIFLITPFLGIADLLGIEKFTFPADSSTLTIILLCGFLNAVSDYCASVASLLTSPLITSLSLSTAIPISMLCDSIFFHTVHTSAFYYLGIILIFSSFVFTSLSDREDVVKEAVEDAVCEAVVYDDTLSPILSPPEVNEDVPGMSIDGEVQLVVAGGHNGRYFIRSYAP